MSVRVDVHTLYWIGSHVLQFAVGCPHGATVTVISPSQPRQSKAEKLKLALAEHDREIGCGCARLEWQRTERRSSRW